VQGKSLLSEATWARIQGYESVWADRDESDNFGQKHDVSLAKDKVRPDVMEETRLQVNGQN
jgi:IQ and AAA domain-containing protein